MINRLQLTDTKLDEMSTLFEKSPSMLSCVGEIGSKKHKFIGFEWIDFEFDENSGLRVYYDYSDLFDYSKSFIHWDWYVDLFPRNKIPIVSYTFSTEKLWRVEDGKPKIFSPMYVPSKAISVEDIKEHIRKSKETLKKEYPIGSVWIDNDYLLTDIWDFKPTIYVVSGNPFEEVIHDGFKRMRVQMKVFVFDISVDGTLLFKLKDPTSKELNDFADGRQNGRIERCESIGSLSERLAHDIFNILYFYKGKKISNDVPHHTYAQNVVDTFSGMTEDEIAETILDDVNRFAESNRLDIQTIN